jgi:hypothetical protein
MLVWILKIFILSACAKDFDFHQYLGKLQVVELSHFWPGCMDIEDVHVTFWKYLDIFRKISM